MHECLANPTSPKEIQDRKSKDSDYDVSELCRVIYLNLPLEWLVAKLNYVTINLFGLYLRMIKFWFR